MVDTRQLIEELSTHADPVRAVPPRVWAWRLNTVLLAYAGIMLCAMGLRADLLAQLMRPMFAAEITVLGGLLLSAAASCILAMYPDMYQRPSLMRLPYLLAGLMFAMLLYQLWLPHDVRMVMPPTHTHKMECTQFIALSAMLPSALIFIMLRKGATTTPLYAGALAVITAAALGAFILRLSEANDAITHVLLWHYAPIVGFAALGAWLGRALLRW